MSEGEIVRRLVATHADQQAEPAAQDEGVPIYADYSGHRTRALYFAPARVQITDGPLRGRSFKTPTAAARAVVRQYNPQVNDNRNGWGFWQLEQPGPRTWLQAIRPHGADL
ncbi:hypothetical protein [Luedemannella helvata]|uniref:hypothetical protein n=1 Tax=Luedemannella helvata TaxID=349315 RepID=UPI0031D9B5CA